MQQVLPPGSTPLQIMVFLLCDHFLAQNFSLARHHAETGHTGSREHPFDVEKLVAQRLAQACKSAPAPPAPPSKKAKACKCTCSSCALNHADEASKVTSLVPAATTSHLPAVAPRAAAGLSFNPNFWHMIMLQQLMAVDIRALNSLNSLAKSRTPSSGP